MKSRKYNFLKNIIIKGIPAYEFERSPVQIPEKRNDSTKSAKAYTMKQSVLFKEHYILAYLHASVLKT